MTPGRIRLCIVGLAAGVFALVQGPSIAAAVRAGGGTHALTVGVYDSQDQAVYLAFTEQSRRQFVGPMLDNRFSPVSGERLPMAFWAALGGAARLLGVSTIAAYIGALLFGSVLLLLAVAALAERAVGRGAALGASTLVVAAGGVGWIGAVLWAAHRDSYALLENLFPDWFWAHFTWAGELSLSPHFFFVHALQVALLIATLVRPRVATAAAACVAAFVLGIIHPYSLPLTVAILVLVALPRAIAERRLLTPSLLTATGGVVGSAAAAVYYVVLVTSEAGMGSWYRQNVLQSPSPLGIALAYLPLLPLVAMGVAALAKDWWRRAESRLLLAWLALPVALAYVPSPFQRRLLDGYYLPVAFVAAVGWFSWKSRGRAKLYAALALVTLLPMTMLLHVGNHAAALQSYSFRGAIGEGATAAIEWVGERCQDDDLVISESLYVRMWVPYLTERCRTDSAHHHISPRFRANANLLELAFSAGADPSLREAAWGTYAPRARYIILADANSLPPSCASLEAAFGEVRVYSTEGCGVAR